jgi:hypothetical protein
MTWNSQAIANCLRRVRAEENGILNHTERAELQEVLTQLDTAFDWR